VKVLIIAPRFPYPIEKGDKLRLYHQIRILAKSHSIHLVALSDIKVDKKDLEHLQLLVDKIHVFRFNKISIGLNNLFRVFSSLPLQVLYFYNKGIAKKIDQIIEQENPDVIYNQLIRTSEYSKNHKNFKVLDYMDAFSTGMRNRLDNSSIPFKWIYALEEKRLVKYEKEIYPFFDQHSIISNQDRDRIVCKDKNNIHVIPNGVDTDFFRSSSPEKKYDVCFVGNMGYRPNIIAAEFFCKHILPGLVKVKADIKILLAGARPPARVKSLASKNVHVSGWIEDIRTAYDESKVFVAPIFTGIGQQNKVLEAMSMEMPCVCSTTVNNPIGGKHQEHVLVTDSEEGYINAIMELLNNPELRIKLGKNSRQLVLVNYSWDSQVEKLNKLFEKKYESRNK